MTLAYGEIASEAILGSACLVWVLRYMALRLNVLDRPNARSSHAVPTPRGGGAAIAIIGLGAAALARDWLAPTWPSFVIGGVLIAVTGAIDDVRQLRVLWRFAAQIVAAALVVTSLHGVAGELEPSRASLILSLIEAAEVFAVVWLINLFNFMDGIDGLAALQAVFVFGAACGLIWAKGTHFRPVTLLAIAGASAGFLTWNFPPAKIFMGDVGSGFLGFAIASAALSTANAGVLNAWVWVILSSPFICDATVTLATRALRRERVYQAHRSHVYQRLSRRWRSHRAVTLLYAAIDVLWCLPWAIEAQRHPQQAAFLCLVALAPQVLGAIWLGGGRAG